MEGSLEGERRRMKKALLFVLFMALSAVSIAADGGSPETVKDAAQAFVKGSIVVKGEGAAPADAGLSPAQKRMMALRAAKVIALREVSEILDGISVSREHTVVKAASESGGVRTAVQGIVKGAQVIKEAYDPESGMAVVFLSVPMTGPDGVITQLLPQVIPMMPETDALFKAPAEKAKMGYDGLIVDVREISFKPALLNRIITKDGKAVYDPAMVSQKVLVERGAAEYTNDIGKARAVLGERGVKTPAVVKAAGVVGSTDVEVGAEDAGAIYSSNQANNFLEGAKVAFVLQ